MDFAAEKKVLRRELKQKRKNLLESYRHQADRQILERVKSLELYRQAYRIFCYVSMAEEVATRLLLEEMLAEGKIVAVPLGREKGVMEVRQITSCLVYTSDERFSYAFDEKYGYLTSYPTNVGTGMRASVLIHLPSLSLGKKFQAMLGDMGRFGVSVRGVYGEGRENYGSIYEVSNVKTLGPVSYTHLVSDPCGASG